MDVSGFLTPSKPLENFELLSEVMLFAYLGDNAYGKEGLKFVTGAKVLKELYRRFTQKDAIIEALRADAVRKIAAYVQAHPHASSSDQAKEIKKHIDDFAVKVSLVDAGVIS